MSAPLDKQHMAPSGQQYLMINVNVHARHPYIFARAAFAMRDLKKGKASVSFLQIFP